LDFHGLLPGCGHLVANLLQQCNLLLNDRPVLI
jgi:hypothetical protein